MLRESRDPTAAAMIPTIIHQIWNTPELPDEWRFCVESWRRQHPNWSHWLWTRAASREFVCRSYPAFLDTYDGCSYDIQRIDAIRYLVLHHFGGLYADLDMECLGPFDALARSDSFLIGREPQAHERQAGGRMLCNALMMSPPGHPFLAHALATLRSRNQRILLHSEVLAATGPLMLGQALSSYSSDAAVEVLDETAFYPLAAGSGELTRLLARTPDADAIRAACRERGAHAIHYWANSWARNLAGELRNPQPANVPGYVFHAGMDSPGYDLCNAGRDIESLAAACSADKRAVGFNTDGFLKYQLRPSSTWREIPNRNGDEGLYVKLL